MKFIIKDLLDFFKEERKTLLSTTPKSNDDYMREGTKNCEKRKRGSYTTIVLYDKEELIGWVMFDFYLSRNTIDTIRTYIYVKPCFRRQGYGTELLNKAKREAKKINRIIRVCPHDNRSKAFFRKNNITKKEIVPGY